MRPLMALERPFPVLGSDAAMHHRFGDVQEIDSVCILSLAVRCPSPVFLVRVLVRTRLVPSRATTIKIGVGEMRGNLAPSS